MGTGALMGGVMGGLGAKDYGGNFWNGKATFYDVAPEKSNYQDAMQRSENYKYGDADDKILKTLAKKLHNTEAGDFINPLTTKPAEKIGLSKDWLFVDANGARFRGSCTGVPGKPPYAVRIAPGLLADEIALQATLGHELIHAEHLSAFASLANTNYEAWKFNSDAAAHNYNYRVYWNAGRYIDAFDYLRRGINYPSNWKTIFHY